MKSISSALGEGYRDLAAKLPFLTQNHQTFYQKNLKKLFFLFFKHQLATFIN